MKKRLSTIMAIVMALGMVFMAGSAWAGTSDPVTFTLDNGQAIEINSPNDPATGTISTTTTYGESATVSVGWLVTTNNGFDINFTGSSVSDTNQEQLFPLFTKQDVTATGALVADNYDHLATVFGVVISGHESVETATSWGSGAVPAGDKEDLVKALAVAGSPNVAIGTIMTSDDASTATVTLHAKGTNIVDAQSGNYTATVTCTVTADEQLNP